MLRSLCVVLSLLILLPEPLMAGKSSFSGGSRSFSSGRSSFSGSKSSFSGGGKSSFSGGSKSSFSGGSKSSFSGGSKSSFSGGSKSSFSGGSKPPLKAVVPSHKSTPPPSKPDVIFPMANATKVEQSKRSYSETHPESAKPVNKSVKKSSIASKSETGNKPKVVIYSPSTPTVPTPSSYDRYRGKPVNQYNDSYDPLITYWLLGLTINDAAQWIHSNRNTIDPKRLDDLYEQNSKLRARVSELENNTTSKTSTDHTPDVMVDHNNNQEPTEISWGAILIIVMMFLVAIGIFGRLM